MTHCRIAAAFALFAATAAAQFSGLSATADGSSLYFASTLRLKGTSPPINGKIFVASSGAVELFRARERMNVPDGSPPCTVAGFRDYLGAETSSAGVVALYFNADSPRGCSYPPNTAITQIVTPSGESAVSGIVRLSRAGRYAIVFAAVSSRPFSDERISFLDRQTGSSTPVRMPSISFPQSVSRRLGSRVIADNGTALLGTSGGSEYGGYILKPGADPIPFPIPNALPIAISADATMAVYQDQNQDLHLLDLRTSQAVFLASGGRVADPVSISDDASRVVFIRNGQLRLVDTATQVERLLAQEITAATISGNGKVVYGVTGRGGLFQISADDGSQIELIGDTPHLEPPLPGSVIAGLAATLSGSNLSDVPIEGTPPFNPYLGKLTMWIGERKVPVIQLEPKRVRFLVPWDVAGPVRILAETPGRSTPFDFPQVEATVQRANPQAGAIARQNWERTFVGPVNTGEVIHVFAIGLGPVAPEVPDGTAAPSIEPLARTAQRLTCSNAEVLYAGLAPGYVERVYQVDLRIGPTPDYQQFRCTLGSEAFIFLTLNVLQ